MVLIDIVSLVFVVILVVLSVRAALYGVFVVGGSLMIVVGYVIDALGRPLLGRWRRA